MLENYLWSFSFCNFSSNIVFMLVCGRSLEKFDELDPLYMTGTVSNLTLLPNFDVTALESSLFSFS